jgi:hypothetical protein
MPQPFDCSGKKSPPQLNVSPKSCAIYTGAYKDAARFYTFTRTFEAYEKSLDEKTISYYPREANFLDY